MDTPFTEIYTISLHDALPISGATKRCIMTDRGKIRVGVGGWTYEPTPTRSEEHTSELQSRGHLVCRLLLEKKKKGLAEKETTGTQVCRKLAAERRRQGGHEK